MMSRRDEMRHFAQSIMERSPNTKPGTVATQLRRKQDFRNRFPQRRRTIEIDVAATMKFGKPE